jgi:hypothetical protein
MECWSIEKNEIRCELLILFQLSTRKTQLVFKPVSPVLQHSNIPVVSEAN